MVDDVMDWLKKMAELPAAPRDNWIKPKPSRSSVDATVELVIPTEHQEIRIHVHIAHIYMSRETANYGGGDHVVVESSWFKVGRIERESGQTLCLWKLRPGTRHGGYFQKVEGTREPSCKRCIEVMEKIGASLVVTA